jgi:pyruvate formate lyase activating enzyme
MQIAGIQKTTLLDYPGKVATTIFTAGCNFRCGFCHNAEQVLPELIVKESSHFIPEEAFFNFLDQRKSILDAVVICGGEPTLQPDLKNFIQKIKNLGFLVKLDTNGHAVDIVRDLIDEKLIDYVAMDIKTSPSKYAELVGVDLGEKYFASHNAMLDLLKNSGIEYEFRTTVIK